MESGVFSRAKFLKSSFLFGGGFVALGMGALTFSKKYSEPLFALSAYTGQVAFSFCNVLLAGVTHLKDDADATIRRLDEELFFVHEDIRSDFNAALYLLEFLPFKYGFPGRFSSLSEKQAIDFLNKLTNTTSDLERAAYNNLRMVIFMIYYGLERAWLDIHYNGPFTGRNQRLTESRTYYKNLINGA